MDWFIPEWLIALSFTLYVVDIFLRTELLSWCGVLSLSTWLTWRIGAPLAWSVLVFVAAFTFFAFFYVFLLRNTIGRMVRKLILGGAPEETLHAVVGKTGIMRLIDGRSFVSVDGELWPLAAGSTNLADGMKVKVVSMLEGEVKAKAL